MNVGNMKLTEYLSMTLSCGLPDIMALAFAEMMAGK